MCYTWISINEINNSFINVIGLQDGDVSSERTRINNMTPEGCQKEAVVLRDLTKVRVHNNGIRRLYLNHSKLTNKNTTQGALPLRLFLR